MKLLAFTDALRLLASRGSVGGLGEDFAIEKEDVPLRDGMTLRRLEQPCRGDGLTER